MPTDTVHRDCGSLGEPEPLISSGSMSIQPLERCTIGHRPAGIDRHIHIDRLESVEPDRQIVAAWCEPQMLRAVEVIDDARVEAVDMNRGVVWRDVEAHFTG